MCHSQVGGLLQDAQECLAIITSEYILCTLHLLDVTSNLPFAIMVVTVNLQKYSCLCEVCKQVMTALLRNSICLVPVPH
jgi:hypothetical protein